MCLSCLETFAEQFAAPENAGQSILGWSFDSVSDGDMLARLPLIAATSAQVDRYLRESVGEIRGRHLSYAEIGKALGVSRQAAWERFSRADDGPHPDTGAADITIQDGIGQDGIGQDGIGQDGTDPTANTTDAASV